MKKSQIKEFRAKTASQLVKMLSDEKSDLNRIFIEMRSRRLRNTALIANKKKTISVLSTIIREQELTRV